MSGSTSCHLATSRRRVLVGAGGLAAITALNLAGASLAAEPATLLHHLRKAGP